MTENFKKICIQNRFTKYYESKRLNMTFNLQMKEYYIFIVSITNLQRLQQNFSEDNVWKIFWLSISIALDCKLEAIRLSDPRDCNIELPVGKWFGSQPKTNFLQSLPLRNILDTIKPDKPNTYLVTY